MDEYELISETPTVNIKEIELMEGNNKYKCQIELINKYLQISIYTKIIKYEGKIYISNVEYNLGLFNYKINEIFDEIYNLTNNKFNLIKDIDKYILKIEFIILNKKRLYETIHNDNNNDNNKTIKELNEKIKEKD